MRKLFLSTVLAITAMLAFSQTPLTQAVDFTGTTLDGTEFNLFEKLDGGQYVCIDFFFTS